MTGPGVKATREALGLDPFALAAVLGVHVTSIYRWEGSPRPKISQLQLEILEGLRRASRARGIGKELGDQIRKALMSGGSLAALRVVIFALTPQETTHG